MAHFLPNKYIHIEFTVLWIAIEGFLLKSIAVIVTKNLQFVQHCHWNLAKERLLWFLFVGVHMINSSIYIFFAWIFSIFVVIVVFKFISVNAFYMNCLWFLLCICGHWVKFDGIINTSLPSHMATKILTNIGSGIGLFAWRQQAITLANVDLASVRSRGLHLREISIYLWF